MDLSFGEEQEALRGLAAEIFRGRVSHDRLKEVEAGPDRVDRALWTELARANLLGVGVPEELGGVGGGILEACILLEQAGAAVAPVPLWPAIVLGAIPLAELGTREQKESLLPGLVAGEVILSAALVEPDSDDLLHPRTAASWEGDAWRLEGAKTAVPAAHVAGRVLTPASSADGAGVFLLDPGAGGVTLARQDATSGEVLSMMTLDGAAVPEAEVVVEPGARPEAPARIVDLAVVGLCALQVGLAESALRLTAEYTSGREQFGRPLAKFQAVQQRAADCYIDVQAMRWTMWQAAWRLSEGLPATEEVAIAKFWAAEGGQRVLSAAQHLHGGIGVDKEYPLYRYTVWSKQVELTLGAATPQLVRLGDELARKAGV